MRKLIIECPKCKKGKITLTEEELKNLFTSTGSNSVTIKVGDCPNPECGHTFIPEEIQEARKCADRNAGDGDAKKGFFAACWKK